MNTFSVSGLSNYIKDLFDSDQNLSHISVRGELSNYKIHSAGHHYFSLKDENAVIDAVFFKGNASRLRFVPKDGMKVIVFGSVSSFPKSGRYQIYVSDMQPEGVGALYVAFEELKNKLYTEGLFDESLKKEIPEFPLRIGLV
ncbi:MAG: exodeoxyribonuclease VII large subunit, partial [Clostridia bacterium]|nr:exodeoxyribonuclease VII large subunit [Clostridia bacterium]